MLLTGCCFFWATLDTLRPSKAQDLRTVMAWIIGTLGIMMGTFVVVLGGEQNEAQLTWPYRKLGVFLLVMAAFLMLLTLINALILEA
jgi:hypothetical protein